METVALEALSQSLPSFHNMILLQSALEKQEFKNSIHSSKQF